MKAPTALATLAFLAIASAAGTACSSALNDPGSVAARRSPVRVHVSNNNWQDVRVYAMRGHARHRLGMVRSMRTTIFTVPAHVYNGTGQVQLMVAPIGSSETFTSLPIPVEPGVRIDWRVQQHLPNTSAMVH